MSPENSIPLTPVTWKSIINELIKNKQINIGAYIKHAHALVTWSHPGANASDVNQYSRRLIILNVQSVRPPAGWMNTRTHSN